jgi:hypothetical protein
MRRLIIILLAAAAPIAAAAQGGRLERDFERMGERIERRAEALAERMEASYSVHSEDGCTVHTFDLQQQPHRPTTPFEMLQKKYSDRDGYTVIEISGSLLGLGDNEAEGVKDIRIITAEEQSDTFTRDMKSMVTPDHKVLTSVSAKDQTTLFYFIKARNSDRIRELVMILYGEDDNMIMVIRGDFSIPQIRSIIGDKMPK